MKMRTLKSLIKLNGIGLHTGEMVDVELIPSDHGRITFIRDGVEIDAHYENVTSTDFAVTLSKNGKSISTVEHLLSVLNIYGIQSLYIKVSSGEIPIYDGSSKVFINSIGQTGLRAINKEANILKINFPITIRDNDKSISFYPADRLIVDYTISFDHPLLKNVREVFDINKRSYDEEIGISRTFTFLEYIEKLKEKDLIKGGSFDNAIVLDKKGIVNGEFRIANECLKHKVLDLLGDIYLTGKHIVGRIIVYKGGHSLGIKACKALCLSPKDLKVNSPLYNLAPNYFK